LKGTKIKRKTSNSYASAYKKYMFDQEIIAYNKDDQIIFIDRLDPEKMLKDIVEDEYKTLFEEWVNKNNIQTFSVQKLIDSYPSTINIDNAYEIIRIELESHRIIQLDKDKFKVRELNEQINN
ncbi:MAG: hypothetical protein DRN27_10275, partial [Thermoplasmata archaeon]